MSRALQRMRTKARFLANSLFILALFLSACAPSGGVPTVEHAVRPGNPVYQQLVFDCNTGETLPADYSSDGPIQPGEGCDSWQINRYERPFNAQSQDIFFPDLDILSAELGSDGQWFYFRLTIFDQNQTSDDLEGTYAIEIDIDIDGRGDVLALVHAPGEEAAQDWTVLGTQFWGDSNNDVGDQQPRVPDPPSGGDGFDTKVFDQGQGDPDADPQYVGRRSLQPDPQPGDDQAHDHRGNRRRGDQGERDTGV